MLTQSQMFEKSFMRPTDFFKLSPETQWAIDKSLGILDWEGGGAHGGLMTFEEEQRFQNHYK